MIYADQDVNGYVERIMPAYDALESLPGDLPAIGESMLMTAHRFVTELAIAHKEFPDTSNGLKINGLSDSKASMLVEALGGKIDDFAKAWYEVVADAVKHKRFHRAENVMAEIVRLRGMDVNEYRKANRDPGRNPCAFELLREDAEKGML